MVQIQISTCTQDPQLQEVCARHASTNRIIEKFDLNLLTTKLGGGGVGQAWLIWAANTERWLIADQVIAHCTSIYMDPSTHECTQTSPM